MDYNELYRQVDTPTLVRHFANEVNAAELIPDPEGKHLLTKQAEEVVDGVTMIDADITIKTADSAGTAFVTMGADVWAALPKLPDDFFGEDFGEDDDE